MRNAGANALDPTTLKCVKFEVGRMVICADHFFKEEYWLMDCKPLHEMLGALIDKIPSKVGKTYERAAFVCVIVLKYSGFFSDVHQGS
jgi:hypothetical protein